MHDTEHKTWAIQFILERTQKLSKSVENFIFHLFKIHAYFLLFLFFTKKTKVFTFFSLENLKTYGLNCWLKFLNVVQMKYRCNSIARDHVEFGFTHVFLGSETRENTTLWQSFEFRHHSVASQMQLNILFGGKCVWSSNLCTQPHHFIHRLVRHSLLRVYTRDSCILSIRQDCVWLLVHKHTGVSSCVPSNR